MFVLALLFGAHAACPAPVSVPAWTQAMDLAEERFAELELEVFADAIDVAMISVPCLDARVERAHAVRFHLLVGLASYARGDRESARRAFAAARAVEPSASLPTSLVPEGHEVHELVDGARTAGAVQGVDPPESGELRFDGAVSRSRPIDRPTLAQWIRADGIPGSTAYLFPQDALLVYPPLAAPVPVVPVDAPAQPERAAPGRRGARVGLWFGAGLAAVGSAVLYGVGASEARRLDGPHPESATVDDIRGIQRRANTWVGLSAASGAVAGVAVAGSLVFR